MNFVLGMAPPGAEPIPDSIMKLYMQSYITEKQRLEGRTASEVTVEDIDRLLSQGKALCSVSPKVFHFHRK